jgi:hypothetical protein
LIIEEVRSPLTVMLTTAGKTFLMAEIVDCCSIRSGDGAAAKTAGVEVEMHIAKNVIAANIFLFIL